MTPTYDVNGSLKTRTQGASTDAYSYDGERRMVAADVQIGAPWFNSPKDGVSCAPRRAASPEAVAAAGATGQIDDP